MKKLLGIVVLGLLLSSNAHADKIKKNGFLIPTNKWKDKIEIDETFKVNNPKDKIIIIHNHGSSYADVKVKDCFWVSQLRNFSQLAGDKINEKEIMVYVHCQNHLEGDLGAKLSKTKYWTKKWEGPYPGTTKIDRRVSGNLEIVKKFIEQSFELGYKKVLIITGKGSRSKIYDDPYRSKKMNTLRYSVPEYIKNEEDFCNKISGISEADLKDGGEGAIYVYLKQQKKTIE